MSPIVVYEELYLFLTQIDGNYVFLVILAICVCFCCFFRSFWYHQRLRPYNPPTAIHLYPQLHNRAYSRLRGARSSSTPEHSSALGQRRCSFHSTLEVRTRLGSF